MVNLPTRHDEKLAIEKCLRSFIIKSIHAIVQARNGIVCNTNCVSEVGARNNMMVYVEEDPEIGATIKQTLDANFPVHVQDLLSLEILAHWPKEPQTLMVVEVWQFRLDIIERLDTATLQFTNNPNSTTCGNNTNSVNNNLPYTATTGAGSYPDDSKSTEYAVDDFRHLRLFEKLGTLLKSIMVVTRLLPGYQLSRRQNPNEYQMCYTLRRGPSDLTRLGSTPKSYQVGRIFSGLAIPQSFEERKLSSPSSSPIDKTTATKLGSDTGLAIADGLLPVYLGTTVHYRTELLYSSSNKLVPIVVDGFAKGNLSAKNGIQEIFDTNGHQSVDLHALHNNRKSHKHVRVSETPIIKPVTTNRAVDMIRFEQPRLPCRVKPAFVVEQYESEPDELFDPASQLLSRKSAERVARRFKHTGVLETQDELASSSHDDEEDEEEDDDHECDGHCGRDEGGGETDSTDSNVDNESSHTIDNEVLRVKQQEMEANDQHHQQQQHNNNIIDIDLKELIRNLRSQCTSSLNDKESGSDDDDIINKQVPLQLPFSTFGVSGARLTHLFAELRERANLDLFQVPQTNTVISNNPSTVSSTTGIGNNNNTTAQSSLFDADALADELERHERMLKEFDDFLSDFQNIEPFGIVRPAVPPDVTAATRQQHINNNPSNIPTTLLMADTRTPHSTVNGM